MSTQILRFYENGSHLARTGPKFCRLLRETKLRVIPTQASRRLSSLSLPVNAAAPAVEESLFDLNSRNAFSSIQTLANISTQSPNLYGRSTAAPHVRTIDRFEPLHNFSAHLSVLCVSALSFPSVCSPPITTTAPTSSPIPPDTSC